MSQWAWVHEHWGDVESDFSALHRIDEPDALPPQRFINLAWRLVAYQGAVRHGVSQEVEDGGGGAPSLDGDRVVDSDHAAADPILGQLIEVGSAEVVF